MDVLIELGYWGLFVGSFLSATLIPFSSDILLVGMLTMGGNVWLCVIIATLGNWLGGLSSYWLGRLGKWEWLERLKVKPETLEKHKLYVDKYGSPLALITWFPLIGDVIAVALGFYRANPYSTAVFMFIGKGARFVVWALLYLWFWQGN